VGAAVAAHALQVHGPLHAVHAAVLDLVAGLEGPLVDPQPLAGELQHLRHERQRIQPAPLVEGGQDLARRAHLDELADPQLEILGLGGLPGPRVVDLHLASSLLLSC
jgi:hypothetical protein